MQGKCGGAAAFLMQVKTRKGREYLKYDNKSHGSPHKINSELFWETKRPFAEKYGVTFANVGGNAPDDPDARRAEFSEIQASRRSQLAQLARNLPTDLLELTPGQTLEL